MPLMWFALKRELWKEGRTITSLQEACRIAQEIRYDHYTECSALTGELMQEVFDCDGCRKEHNQRRRAEPRIDLQNNVKEKTSTIALHVIRHRRSH